MTPFSRFDRRLLFGLLALLGLVACDQKRSATRKAAARDFSCPVDEIVANPSDPANPTGARWLAEGCGHSELYDCYEGGRHYGASCTRVTIIPVQPPHPIVPMLPRVGPPKRSP